MLNTSTWVFLTAALLMCFQTGFYSGVKALHGKGKAYTASKMAGCMIFISVAVAALLLHGVKVYGVIMLLGMAVGSVGDYFLSLAQKGRLKAGIGCFLGGHILYIIAFTYAAGFNILPYIVAPAAVAVIMFILRILRFKFRGMQGLAVGYMTVISLMTAVAVFTLFSTKLPRFAAVYISVGAVLFLLSDLLWAVANFSSDMGKKTAITLKILNVITYFPAQLLLATSIMAQHIAF